MHTQLKPVSSHWEPNDIDLKILEIALIEDLGLPYCDITTSLLFENNKSLATAKIISKNPSPIVICGLSIVIPLLNKIDSSCVVKTHYQDGALLQPGETLLTIRGPVTALLMVERTLLNFLQRLCGISTLTAQYVAKISHTQTKVLDTRKTVPGLRHLEKYAVQCGGGVNHRMGLYDAIMIKDTHIDFIGNIEDALKKIPDQILKQFPVIIEIRSIDELQRVLNHGLNNLSRLLFDNMTPTQLSACIDLCKGKIQTEASGNINLENIQAVAQCGVDFISIGKLTHSANSVDLSMKCET